MKLDHDWFAFRRLEGSRGVSSPGEARLTVLVLPVLQHHRIDVPPPFALPGALDRPYPDIGNASQRAVAWCDGLWRIQDALASRAIPASYVVEAQALATLGDARDICAAPANAIVAGGEHATLLHTDAMDGAEERAVVRRSVDTLQDGFQREILGWRSPYNSQSHRSLEILADSGIAYVGDFANDDRPYAVHTPAGPLLSVPMNHFYGDLYWLLSCRQTVETYVAATLQAAQVLLRERAAAPPILSLVVHPWLMGATHRASAFEGLLDGLAALPGVVFSTTDAVYRQEATAGA